MVCFKIVEGECFGRPTLLAATDVTARRLEAAVNMNLAVVIQRPSESFLIQRRI